MLHWSAQSRSRDLIPAALFRYEWPTWAWPLTLEMVSRRPLVDLFVKRIINKIRTIRIDLWPSDLATNRHPMGYVCATYEIFWRWNGGRHIATSWVVFVLDMKWIRQLRYRTSNDPCLMFNLELHGGTTEEGNCSYLLPLSHSDWCAGVRNTFSPFPYELKRHGATKRTR